MVVNSLYFLIGNDCIINEQCHISNGVIINKRCEFGKISLIRSKSITRKEVKITSNIFMSYVKRVIGWPIK